MKKIICLSMIILSVFMIYAKQRKKNAENLPLLHTKWILEEMYETFITHSLDTAFIIFSDDYKISGNFGCNLFFGNFNVGKKRMQLDYLGSTKRLCMDMEPEEKFSRALRDDITNYYIEKNKLYLRNKNRIVCKFEGKTIPK